jgi:hypothetical protein
LKKEEDGLKQRVNGGYREEGNIEEESGGGEKRRERISRISRIESLSFKGLVNMRDDSVVRCPVSPGNSPQRRTE